MLRFSEFLFKFSHVAPVVQKAYNIPHGKNDREGIIICLELGNGAESSAFMKEPQVTL